jgi:apoptotic chromatin condensation inducer in the nucleus
MGSDFSAMLKPLQNVAKSVGDGLKGIKLPDNPLKDVSLGNKGRNFLKGVRSGLMGNKQVRVQVSTGPLGFGRATQLRSVSSTPRTAFGFLGKVAGDKITRMGRTETKPIFSNNKPSLVERMKQKFKRIKTTKTTNIGNIELSNMSQPPQQIQQGGSKKIQDEKNPSENKKKPSENKKKPSKNETNPSENEKKPSKKEKKPSENKKKPSENKKNPSENKKKPSKKEKNPYKKEKNPSKKEKNPSKKKTKSKK